MDVLKSLLLLLAAVPLWAGCTASPAAAPSQAHNALAASATPAGMVTLTYWEDEQADGDVVLDGLTAEFMRTHPQIKVERVHLSYEELLDKLKRGEAPDAVRCTSECAGAIGALDAFRPVTELFDGAFLDRFLSGSLAAATLKGVLWGVPDNYGNHLLLIHNKDLVDDVPGDTEAWIAQLRTLTDAGRDRYGLAYFLDEPYWLVPWIGGFGGWPIDRADNPTLDTRATVEALDFVRNLKSNEKVVPPKADYDMAQDYFKQGRAAYLIDGDWSLDRLREAGMNFGVSALPRVTASGLDPVPMTSGKYWFVSRWPEGAKLDAARELVEFMTSALAPERWLGKARRLPSLKTVAADPKILNDPILSGSMDALSKGHGLSPAPEMRCIWSAMRPSLEAVMDDRMASAAAAAAMQVEAERCVSKLKSRPTP